MEGGKKRKCNCRCGFQGLSQETPCQKLQQYGEGKINHYCLKHYNQSLQHQQGTEQPRSTNPVDGHIIVSASCSIRQDELHLNQATAQPRSKNPINATKDNNVIIINASTSNTTTDNDGIIVDAFTSIPNEELIQAQTTTQPHSATPINMMVNNHGNVFNPSISIWCEESIGAQATMELDSGVSVEPFPFPSLIGERLLHAALINNSPTTPIQDQATA
jgi:hypothetical protein